MSTFEYVFALYSIMTSLALGVIASGVVRIVRDGRARQTDALEWLWIWVGFTMAVGNWGAFWGLRTLEEWTAPLVLSNLALTTFQYALCEFVVPAPNATGERTSEGTMRVYRQRILWTSLAMIVIAVAGNVATMAFYEGWLRDTISSLGIGVVSVALLFIRRRWFQLAGTSVIAAAGTYFAWMASAIIAQ